RGRPHAALPAQRRRQVLPGPAHLPKHLHWPHGIDGADTYRLSVKLSKHLRWPPGPHPGLATHFRGRSQPLAAIPLRPVVPGEGYPTFNVRWNQVGQDFYLRSTETASVPTVTPFFDTDVDYTLRFTDGIEQIVRRRQSQPVSSFTVPVS